eukprot:15449586-Alexandrium_andersonii.AAC.1
MSVHSNQTYSRRHHHHRHPRPNGPHRHHPPLHQRHSHQLQFRHRLHRQHELHHQPSAARTSPRGAGLVLAPVAQWQFEPSAAACTLPPFPGLLPGRSLRRATRGGK